MNRLFTTTSLLLLPALALAHHGFGGRYDQDNIVELEGEVRSVLWRNPHVRLVLSVDNVDWEIETTSPTVMERYGIVDGLVNEGDAVRVAGYASSRGLNEIAIQNILLPSGREIVLDPRFAARWSDETLGEEGTFLRAREGDASSPELGIFRVWSTTVADPGSYPLYPESADPELSLRYPLTADARAAFDAFDPASGNPIDDYCSPKGMPMIMEQPYPMEFIEQGDTILLRLEEYDLVREIRMVEQAPEEPATILGTSIGRWDGDTLVVTTSNIDWHYFNQMGVGQTPDAVVEERFTPSADGSRLSYRMTMTDPAIFTAPVVLEKFWLWRPEVELLQFDCTLTG